MRKLILGLVALCTMTFAAAEAEALNPCEIKNFATAAARDASTPKDCTIGYALDDDTFKWRANSAWVAISTGTTLTGAQSGTIDNAVNYKWSLNEVNDAAEAEDIDFDFTTANQVTLSSNTGVATLVTALDLSLGGGAGAVTMTNTASSIVVPANDTTALLIGPAAQPGLVTIDSGTATETVQINGTTTVLAFDVATGLANFAEATTFQGGAGAITLDNTAASVLVADNDASALDIGSAGATAAMRYVSTNNAENFILTAGLIGGTTSITGVVSLDASDCGKTHFVTAAADGDDITLPDTTTHAGCQLTFVYIGADNGCLLDISPNASDAVHGTATLAASVVEFSGTDDADIGLTKATSNTGDSITIVADGTEGWYVTASTGIWANN